jgi:hypothetical protein
MGFIRSFLQDAPKRTAASLILSDWGGWFEVRDKLPDNSGLMIHCGQLLAMKDMEAGSFP